ncbi:MAG: calcium/sodium antiporter [Kiritimatiellae bacterium]|nr:calcium/sodium antiporter [Kiritimatiellia bacterium]
MALAIAMVLGGLAALAWSSDTFVDGAATLARLFGISPFVVGMVIIGFGTSAPELCVSALSSFAGHSNLSLGNAYGSCIFNIVVILGVASLIRPLAVKPGIVFIGAPALTAITCISYVLLRNGVCGRFESLVLLGLFAVLLPVYCWLDQKGKPKEDSLAQPSRDGGAGAAAIKTLVGLAVLVGSSHVLVWGSVSIAHSLHVSDLLIGLTIIAVGTSLPELASAIASARRGETELVLGNIIGSNFFNTLAVVGLAGTICPIRDFSKWILLRDLPLMALASLSIIVFGINLRKPREEGMIGRVAGLLWILSFVAYTGLMLYQETR